MRVYVIVTGVIFALITIAHIAMETHVLREPFFLLLTLLAAALSIWAFAVLRRVSN